MLLCYYHFFCLGNYHTPDTDECSEGIDDCNMNAICNNTEGHHTCQCSEGYDGDGETCYGLLWLYFLLTDMVIIT